MMKTAFWSGLFFFSAFSLAGCVPIGATMQPTQKLESPSPAITQATTAIAATLMPTPVLTPTTVTPAVPDNTGESSSSPLGRIYVDDRVIYGFLDPSKGFQLAINPITPKPSDVIDPTNNAISLAFSYYSQLVAYVTNASGELHLWVGDLNLNEVDLVWSDRQNWLNYDSDNYDEVAMQWRVTDKFITLENRSNIVLISIDGGLETRLSGPCDWIGISPKTGYFSAWCPVVSDTESYVVLEKDGSFWPTSSLPKDHFSVSGWVFSPTGDRALYATEQGDLIILDEKMKPLVLPITYAPPRWDITMRVLQWSQDGNLILVYGYDKSDINCTNAEKKEYPCWRLLDSNSGEIIWQPSGDLSLSDYDATISPDGKWLVLFVMTIPDRNGYIVSVETNEAKKISDWVVNAVSWGY